MSQLVVLGLEGPSKSVKSVKKVKALKVLKK